MDMISHVVAGIYKDSRHQSERDLPDMSPFRNGLNAVAKLKAKERYARIYIAFLTFSIFLIYVQGKGKSYMTMKLLQ